MLERGGAQLRPFRFLHEADLHLDSPFKGLTSSPSAIRDYIRESTFIALTRMAQIAIEQQVDFVVISGDVYDLTDRSFGAQLSSQRASLSVSEEGIHVYIIHGNHDAEDGARARSNWPPHVHVFGSYEVTSLSHTDFEGHIIATVSGISYG